MIPVVIGTEAHVLGGVQNASGDGWWAYNNADEWSKPTSFVNAYGDGRWYNFSMPVLANNPQGHIWVKSLRGGHIYVDTYAQ